LVTEEEVEEEEEEDEEDEEDEERKIVGVELKEET